MAMFKFWFRQHWLKLAVHEAIAYMHENYPELAVDGEMQVKLCLTIPCAMKNTRLLA